MTRQGKRWRRRARRLVRTLLFSVILLGALPGLVAAGASGEWQLLWFVPAGMVAAPFLAVGAVLGLLTMSLPLLAVGLAFGGPLFLFYRAMDGQRRPVLAVPAEVVLRRRYVAGELSYEAFRAGMLDLLKDRVAAGEMTLTEYEAELDRLLLPGRHLDAGRDPRLSGTLGTLPR